MDKIGTSSITTMNKLFALILLVVLQSTLHAQYTFERQTLSCIAVSACDQICINSTAGQIDFGTLTNDQNIVTSGFEQNDGEPALYVEIAVLKDECLGTYEARIIQTYGCSSADSIRYYWNELETSTVANLGGAQNVLRVSTNTGCVFERSFDFDELGVQVKPCELVFHNFCSPNGDGDNDSWQIDHIDVESYAVNEVFITNRWGAEVFHVKNYDNANRNWSGQDSNGQQLPDGTYFYTIRIGETLHNGYIELVR
jgi:gliding motility-associated-like protein